MGTELRLPSQADSRGFMIMITLNSTWPCACPFPFRPLYKRRVWRAYSMQPKWHAEARTSSDLQALVYSYIMELVFGL